MNSELIKINCVNCGGRYEVSEFPPFTDFPCPDCGTLLRTPKKFGRYFLDIVYSRCWVADIYRAADPALMRNVAIKIAPKNSKFGDMQELFCNEAKLIAPLAHSAVVPVYDCGVVEDEAFLVMQYMDGGDLGHHMVKHTLPAPEKLITYIQNVAVGLHFLFLSNSIVHHDIRPGNILLTSEGEAKIGHFDFADRRENGDVNTLCPLWYSPGYVSPERLKHGGEDHRGDIFSLGVSIYELFGGKLPYASTGTAEELFNSRQQPPVPLKQLCPFITEEISQLVDGMLAFNMEARPTYPEIVRTLHL